MWYVSVVNKQQSTYNNAHAITKIKAIEDKKIVQSRNCIVLFSICKAVGRSHTCTQVGFHTEWCCRVEIRMVVEYTPFVIPNNLVALSLLYSNNLRSIDPNQCSNPVQQVDVIGCLLSELPPGPCFTVFQICYITAVFKPSHLQCNS